MMAKTRVASRQLVSLPSLELMAAVIACRLRNYMVLEVRVTQISFYTGSMVTYYWCTSSSVGRWKTFIANRVTEIQSSSRTSECFRWLVKKMSPISVRAAFLQMSSTASQTG